MAMSLKYIQTTHTTSALVYRAFTKSTAMRKWLCGLQLLQINAHAREHAGQISLAVSAARH